MLAGLSQCWIFKTPPAFWASAGPALVTAIIKPPANAATHGFRAIGLATPFVAPELPVEPDVFEAPAVVDAVDHDRQPLDRRLPAGALDIVEDDRPGAVLLQSPVDLPDQFLALVLVGQRRL